MSTLLPCHNNAARPVSSIPAIRALRDPPIRGIHTGRILTCTRTDAGTAPV